MKHAIGHFFSEMRKRLRAVANDVANMGTIHVPIRHALSLGAGNQLYVRYAGKRIPLWRLFGCHPEIGSEAGHPTYFFGENIVMIETLAKLAPNDRVRVSGPIRAWALAKCCVSRETGGLYVADVVFESRAGRRLETLPVERLERAISPWEKLRAGNFDNPKDFLLRQLAWQFALGNTGGELTNSRTQLCRIRFCSRTRS